MWEIFFQIFVAFSEKLNFMLLSVFMITSVGGLLFNYEYEMNDLIDIRNTNQFDKHYKILKCYVIELVSVFMITSVGGFYL